MIHPFQQRIIDKLLRVRDPNQKPGAYPGPETETGQKRMAQDLQKISDYWTWPDSVLHMKAQPWTDHAGRKFGTIELEERLQLLYRVHVKGGGVEEFDSLADLVREWSVD